MLPLPCVHAHSSQHVVFFQCARACVFVCVCVPGSRVRLKPPDRGRKGELRILLEPFSLLEVPLPLLALPSLPLFSQGPRVWEVRCDFVWVKNKKQMQISARERIRKRPFRNPLGREFPFAAYVFCNQDLITHMSGSSNAKNAPLFEVFARRQKIPFRR